MNTGGPRRSPSPNAKHLLVVLIFEAFFPLSVLQGKPFPCIPDGGNKTYITMYCFVSQQRIDYGP